MRPMDSQRWQKIQTLFAAALALPEEQRDAYLERECGDDNVLKAEVLKLLDADAGGATNHRGRARCCGRSGH